jgi:hypothetical protein
MLHGSFLLWSNPGMRAGCRRVTTSRALPNLGLQTVRRTYRHKKIPLLALSRHQNQRIIHRYHAREHPPIIHVVVPTRRVILRWQFSGHNVPKNDITLRRLLFFQKVMIFYYCGSSRSALELLGECGIVIETERNMFPKSEITTRYN